MPLRGKWRVLGSNFQELQMAPLLLTTGNRLHRPVNTFMHNSTDRGAILKVKVFPDASYHRLNWFWLWAGNCPQSPISNCREALRGNRHVCYQVHIRLLHTEKKNHTHPMWQLPLWVQFSDFCNSKIGGKKTSISVEYILHYLKYTHNKELMQLLVHIII